MLDRLRNVCAAAVAALALAGASRPAHAKRHRPSWASAAAPTPGPARVIGRHESACISGAVELPLQGPGFQAVDVSRRRYFGHPALVDFAVDLGRAVYTAGLGTMLVGDMAQPRGGPMSFGHVSHQGGLDVDIWFRLDVGPLPVARRDGLAQPLVVDARTGQIDRALWTARQAELVRLAALDPRVSRVFVGAALKRDLCERVWPDRGWLRVVRPWPGHDDHLHVRLSCPADSPDCIDQAEAVGDGCGHAELAAAMAREIARRRHPPPAPNRVLPASCDEVREATSAPAAPTLSRSD
jgi:penicillin-insensitive murein endopeptidase